MQTPSVAPPPPPPPGFPQPAAIATEEGGRAIVLNPPMTARDLRALRIRREDLSDQLISVQSRRKDVAEALKAADPAARPGLQDRLRVLDDRIVQIETDIATTGRELTSAPAGLAAVQGSDVPNFIVNADDGDGPAFFGGLLVGMAAVALMTWVRRMRRGGTRRQQAVAGVPAEQLARLEQSIDAIAVEVERISEGQRFTAKLMADGQERLRREAALRDA